jgi:hypothetical protein
MQSAPTAGPTASDPKWVVIKQWTGRAGRTETEKFTTTGESWRVSWKTLAGDPDPIGSLSIAVRDASGHLIRMASNLGQKITSGSFDVHVKAGTYYLDIEGADRRWSVAAEGPR